MNISYCILRLVTFFFIICVPLTASDSVAQWRNDIGVMKKELARIHPRFQSCGLPANIESSATSLSYRLKSLTDQQIVVELQRILASVGDGHTLVLPFGMKRGSLFRLPLMLWQFEDGLYVIDAAEPRFIGRKVIRIGLLTTDEVLKMIDPYISRDNNQQVRWAAPFYCTVSDFLQAIGAVKERKSATIAFDDGTEHTFVAAAIDPSLLDLKLISPRTMTQPGYLLSRDSMFYTREINSRILYVAINGINDSQQATLETFGIELRQKLSSYEYAVIDLRLNSGGDALKADELFKTLVAFDVRKGKLAVLIGRMTFSAARTFATRIDQWTNAVFVGEPTGSRPNHYGNERSFKLPYSGVRISVSSGYNQPVTVRDERAEIIPDIAVTLSARDYFEGKDPVLEAAINTLVKLK